MCAEAPSPFARCEDPCARFDGVRTGDGAGGGVCGVSKGGVIYVLRLVVLSVSMFASLWEFTCLRELLPFDFRQVQHVEPLREAVPMNERVSHGDAATHKSQRRSKMDQLCYRLLSETLQTPHVLTVCDVDHLPFLGFHLALRVRVDSVRGPHKSEFGLLGSALFFSVLFAFCWRE